MRKDTVIVFVWGCVAALMYIASDTPLYECAAYAAVMIGVTQAIMRQSFGPLCGPMVIGMLVLLHILPTWITDTRTDADPLFQLAAILLSHTGVLLASGIAILFSTASSYSIAKTASMGNSFSPGPGAE